MKKPTLLLHACCAPCTTSVYEKISNDFDVTLFWFNPNIEPKDEYEKRFNELKRFTKTLSLNLIVDNKYMEDNQSWNILTKNYADEKEGGNRCRLCIKNRLINTAKYAKNNNFDYFATTLTVSPHKNSKMVNEIGNIIAEGLEIKFLDSDFKKEGGYLRSIELSKKYNLYRQDYCGCKHSVNSKSEARNSKQIQN